MCSTPKSDKTTTTTTTTTTSTSPKCNQSIPAAPATGETTENFSRVKLVNEVEQQTEGNSGEICNNNNNSNSNTGKTSSTSCAKNKQAVGQSGFQVEKTDELDGKVSTAIGGATPVSIEIDGQSSVEGALLTTGLGRLAAGSRLAPGNQPIFGGGGGGGKGTTTNADSQPAVYSKTGELIVNYASNNAIISSNPATKRKNTKVSASKRNQSVQNNSKRKINKLSNGQTSLKTDTEIFLTTSSGGKTNFKFIFL